MGQGRVDAPESPGAAMEVLGGAGQRRENAPTPASRRGAEAPVSGVWHIITCEYPPQPGGVSDYTHRVASGLGAVDESVHVWCPPAQRMPPPAAGVTVHPELGAMSWKDLLLVGKRLNRFRGRRRLLLQWVPHGYGYQSMNLWLCLWVWGRAVFRRDHVQIMVHEPYLAFQGSWRQRVVAVVHRVMTVILLLSTRRVWAATLAAERCWRPYRLGRKVAFGWLPVPSNIAPEADPAEVGALRSRLLSGKESGLIGHFGTYNRDMGEQLIQLLPAVLRRCTGAQLLLLGRGGEAMREQIAQLHPDVAERIRATGALPAAEVSLHISACDLLLQPYPEGVSARRTSVMVGLSHGVPVVTTTGPLTEPVWQESGAVALAPSGQVDTLVSRVEELLGDHGARRRAGDAARALYEERFDLRHTIAKLRQSAGSDR